MLLFMIYEHRAGPRLTTPSTNAATTKLVKRMATGMIATALAGTQRDSSRSRHLGCRGRNQLADGDVAATWPLPLGTSPSSIDTDTYRECQQT